MDGQFLACDWGGTNLRAWRIAEDGQVLAAQDFPWGVSRLQPGEAVQHFRRDVRPALKAQGLPAILCGMIGSNLGWQVVDYLDCPAGMDDLCRGLERMDDKGGPAWIVPGLRGPGLTESAPDVMRGEETQIFGWLGQDESRRKGRRIVCHPGTHSKWVLVQDGLVERFVTVMTGELFDLLRKHSLLKSEATADDMAAFDEGLDAAADGGALSARLFSARSRVTGGWADAQSTPSYVSGLLIGAELAGAHGLLGAASDEPVDLIGEPKLCDRYARALRQAGRTCHQHDGDQAVLAGLTTLFRKLVP
jgi:2-dehydro-3-deoxygalactonokinase